MSQLANRWPFPDNPQLADFVRAVCAILNGGITVSNFSTGMKNTPKGVPTLTPAGKIRADQLPGGSAAFTTGDRLLCAAATAPTGWTQVATWNDMVLRVVSGAGAGTGGTWTISGITNSSESAHTHAGGSHTHGQPAHAHTIAHTHTTDTHTHTVDIHANDYTGSFIQSPNQAQTCIRTVGAAASWYGTGNQLGEKNGKRETTASGAGGTTSGSSAANSGNGGSDDTGAPTGAYNTGAGTGHTHTATGDGVWRPAYLDVIVIEAA